MLKLLLWSQMFQMLSQLVYPATAEEVLERESACFTEALGVFEVEAAAAIHELPPPSGVAAGLAGRGVAHP